MIFPNRVFIIAEAGVNHNGDVELAKCLVDAASDAGADAVKFQTFKAERVVNVAAPKAAYQLETTDPSETQLNMVRRLELSAKAHEEIIAHAGRRSIMFLSTPFDEESVDLLDRLDVPAFKIASGEITNWPFLRYVARRGKPVILSTGMSDLEEVSGAVRQLRESGCIELVLLHCVSSYPTDPADANLRAMQTMASTFQIPVGFSDHTTGIEIAVAAAALGACMIEKHLTLDKNMPGPDHRASLEPLEFSALRKAIRNVESALGNGIKKPVANEKDTRKVARRSLYAARDLEQGHPVEHGDFLALRPGTGVSPAKLESLLGRRLKREIRTSEMLQEQDLE